VSGAGRNPSTCVATDSSLGVLRNIRRNLRFKRFAFRNVKSLERMMVQESSERKIRTVTTAMGIGSRVFTISQKFTSRRGIRSHCNELGDKTEYSKYVSVNLAVPPRR